MVPDTLSFLPVSQLLEYGAGGINTAYLHLGFRQNNNKAVPAAMAQLFLNDHIRRKLGYGGLRITEGSFLASVSGKRRGEMEKFAFQLGYDMIIGPASPERAIRKISRLVKGKKEYTTRLNESVRRILAAKYNAGLRTEKHNGKVPGVAEQYHAKALHTAIASSAVTVINNNLNRLPVRMIDNRTFHLIDFGGFSSGFAGMLERYVPFQQVRIRKDGNATGFSPAANDVVIAAVTDASDLKAPEVAAWLKRLRPDVELVIVHAGNPADLISFSDFPSVLEGYHPVDTERFLPQVLFGALSATGTLPVRIPGIDHHTDELPAIGRLSFTEPELAEMDPSVLDGIDSIATEAITSGATPGCRVLIARHGQVVFDRSYGWLAYDKKVPVSESTIYDLASVTKVTATLQTTMFLEERGLVDVHKKASVYLPELKGSNKKDFTQIGRAHV